MSRAFVNSILAVLLIAVYSTTAFPSNIHEKMTIAERLAVFGSKDTVPEYEVFPVTLPGARRRRETDLAIKLKIDLEQNTVYLNLKPTAGYLATKYTPVWAARSDDHAYQNIRYDPLPKAMSLIGEFKMYHDVENDAAVTVYTDIAEGTIMEGFVPPYYAIRPLPKRLMRESLELGVHINKSDWMKKRSIASDASEEDTGHFVLFKVPGVPNYVKPSTLVDLNNHRSEKRDRRAKERGQQRKLPKTLYPEILLVLDYTAISDHTTTYALRYMLGLWNAVDLLYRSFDKPKVRLTIAGIIIAMDAKAAPYTETTDQFLIISEMGKYFYKEKLRFPMSGYDIIITMSAMNLCGEGPCPAVIATVGDASACSSKRDVSEIKNIAIAFAIYNWQFSGIIGAAAALAGLFDARFEHTNENTECPMSDGHIMAGGDPSLHRNFKWSKCSRRFLSLFFSSDNSTCLDNKPRWRKTVGKVLPGRWMSMDGQCRNEGFSRACRLKKKWTCKANGCRKKGSVKCIRTSGIPLPGSECGSDKHCSTKKKCIRN